MEIYIEYVLFDNMVMDFILLYAALTVSHITFLKRRLVLSAAAGAVFAAVMPLIHLKAWVMLALKILCGFLLVYIAAEYKGKKQYLICSAIFFLFTFMLGGLIIALFFMLKIEFSNNGAYISKIPIGVVLAAAFMLYAAVRFITKQLYKKRHIQVFVYKCRLFLNSSSVEVRGFLDSGNRLYYKGGKPVIICGSKTVSGLFKDGLFTQGTRATYIDFQTIAGKNRMLCFKIDKLQIYNGHTVNIIDNIMLGISPFHIKGDEEYDLILHPAVFKGE